MIAQILSEPLVPTFATARQVTTIPFDESAFAGRAGIVVLGDPGSGKSIALRKLMVGYSQSAHNDDLVRFSGLPILIPLRTFSRERAVKGQGYSLIEFMYDQARGMLSVSCSRGFFEHYLDTGECLICLDGLDEVTDSAQRQEIVDIVEAFVTRYPRNRYVATSRIVGYQQAPVSSRVLEHFTLLPFEDADIRSYLDKWYRVREKSESQAAERAAELYATIAQNERLHDLARRPLLLAIIALVHRIEAELPHERVRLYDKCTEALLSTFEAAKRLERPYSGQEYYLHRREILEAVAFQMQTQWSSQNGREVIVSQSELQRYVAAHLSSDQTFSLSEAEAGRQASEFVTMVSERTGLLVERGRKQFAFVHLTFQEYFAASYAARNHLRNLDDIWKVIAPNLLAPSWREVILLLLGKLNEFTHVPSDIVGRILAQEDINERMLHNYLGLATDCIGDNIRLNISLQEAIIDKWIRALRSPFCDLHRDLILARLSSVSGRPTVEETLRKFFTGENEAIEPRLNIARLGLQQNPVPEWMSAGLAAIAQDQNIAFDHRLQAVSSYVLADKKGHNASNLLMLLAGADDSGVALAATELLLISERKQTFTPGAWPILSALPWSEDECSRVVEVEPASAVLFSNRGWQAGWPEFVSFLDKANQPTDQLKRALLAGRLVNAHFVPSKIRDSLIASLVSVAKRPQLGPINAESIHWLNELRCPVDHLFDLVLDIDREVDFDDWNIGVMSSFFEDLSKRAEEFLTSSGQGTGQPDSLTGIDAWMERIRQVNHTTLQVSFVQGLWYRLKEDAVHLTAHIFETSHNYEALLNHAGFLVERRLISHDLKDSVYFPLLMRLIVEGRLTDETFVLARMLWQAYLLSDDEIKRVFGEFFEKSSSRWARGLSAVFLHLIQALSKDETMATLIELASQEDHDMDVKQVLAHEAIKLGATDRGLAILREVISGTHDQNSAKNGAFRALSQTVSSLISQPNLGTSTAGGGLL